MRIIVHPVIQSHLCQKNLCLYLDGGQDFTFSFFKVWLLCGEKLFSKHYIFQSGILRKQIKVLKHKANFFIPHDTSHGVIHAVDILAFQKIITGSLAIQNTHNIHQRTFSGTGFSYNRNKFAPFDFKIDSV